MADLNSPRRESHPAPFLCRTWNDANLECKAVDPDGVATLTSIESPREEVYLFTYAWFWIGGYDAAVEGQWR